MKPKIIIVAGGLGTRMKTIAKNMPKCLVKLGKKPLMQHQIEFFRDKGYTNFIFCVAHYGEQIKKYFRNGSHLGVSISYSEEPNSLLGTAGAVKLAQAMIDSTFIVYYGDNLTNEDLDRVFHFHRQKNSDFTVILRKSPKNYAGSSMITMDRCNRIRAFAEKPPKKEFDRHKTEKMYINNGIYIIEPKILKEIPPNKKYDFAMHLIPKLIRKNMKVYGYVSKKLFEEIGRPEKYEKLKEKLRKNAIEDGWKQSGFFR